MDKNKKEKKEKKALSFKKFLDKSTNLIAIFGIFNALFIYSGSVENLDASSFLLPTFFILSLLVWYELIRFTLKSSNYSWKYNVFLFLAFSIEIGLIWFFVSAFGTLVYSLLVFGIFILVTYLLGILIIKVFRKPLSRLKKSISLNLTYLIIIISFIASGFFLKMVAPALRQVAEIVNTKFIDNLSDTISDDDKEKIN